MTTPTGQISPTPPPALVAPDDLISCHGYEPVYFPDYVVARDAMWRACCDALATELEAHRDAADRYKWLVANHIQWKWHPTPESDGTATGFSAQGTGYCGFGFDQAVAIAMGLHAPHKDGQLSVLRQIEIPDQATPSPTREQCVLWDSRSKNSDNFAKLAYQAGYKAAVELNKGNEK